MRLLAWAATRFWARVLRRVASRESVESLGDAVRNSQVQQRSLFLQHRARARDGALPSLKDVGFRTYSQADEDGILVFLFAVLGFESRVCVDLGSGRPFGANSTNLICNWAFTGLLIDGDAASTRAAAEFYDTHPDTAIYPPTCTTAWVTVENVNELLLSRGVAGEVDLLSLDLDGVDYWVWQALVAVRPRVVVLEFQDIWGPDLSVTVPYDPAFRRPDKSYNYCGASLAAMTSLSARKGYRLVGTNSLGQNAFFVREDLCPPGLVAVSPADCFRNREAAAKRTARLALARQHTWVDV